MPTLASNPTSHMAPVLLLLLILFSTSLAQSTQGTTMVELNGAEQQQQNAGDVTQQGFAHKYQSLHLPMDSYLLDDELYNSKRASMRGFQGMRGKKSLQSYYDSEPLLYYSSEPADYNYYPKRAPMQGFQGMRGKKNREEVLEEWEKRAMLGFQGMRGKKSSDILDSYNNNNGEDVDAAAWQSLKRAPMGFQGMRGRKSYYEQLLNDELEKRAMLGFQGMRGKKDLAGYDADVDGYLEKRPMMGFHGMRGKRSVEADSGRVLSKRSLLSYGQSRGKKNPRWELRGKFVGVRGKKWTEQPSELQPLLLNYYNNHRLSSLMDNERMRH